MSSTRKVPFQTDSTSSKTNFDQNNIKRRRLPPKPSSILDVFRSVILNFFKRIIFFNPYLRILIYSVSLFAISGIADVLTMPKVFGNHFFNRYFVKLGWFWTLSLSIPFVFMTSHLYCLGKSHLRWRHYGRLVIATFFWYFWVNFFVYVENYTGYCTEKQNLKTKTACSKAGFLWKGFDLSGHAFILIYSNLVLIEEAKPILGWEGIQDIIEKEEYSRTNALKIYTPLREFTTSQFDQLRLMYEKYLPYVRLNFALIACLINLWDYMLLSTILYFHSMPEKLLSGIIAIFVWYITYQVLYKQFNLLPGQGSFVYAPVKVENNSVSRKRSSS